MTSTFTKENRRDPMVQDECVDDGLNKYMTLSFRDFDEIHALKLRMKCIGFLLTELPFCTMGEDDPFGQQTIVDVNHYLVDQLIDEIFKLEDLLTHFE